MRTVPCSISNSFRIRLNINRRTHPKKMTSNVYAIVYHIKNIQISDADGASFQGFPRTGKCQSGIVTNSWEKKQLWIYRNIPQHLLIHKRFSFEKLHSLIGFLSERSASNSSSNIPAYMYYARSRWSFDHFYWRANRLGFTFSENDL